MFTYLASGRGLVQTGKSGHAYIFKAKSGETYIYNRELAVGAQSNVQLVTNISTHEAVVRKDNELRILDLLNSIRQDPVYPQPDITPRWTTCISHEDLALKSTGPRPRLQCAQVSYWKLCNGSDLADLSSRWFRGSFGEEMEGHVFPVCLIARCIAQVCETLHFMYQAGPEAVYHNDLHPGNIFLHYDSSNGGLPDFYLGDFGLAFTANEDLARRAKQAPIDPKLFPGIDGPNERERWDVSSFGSAIESIDQYTRIPFTDAFDPPSPKTLSIQSARLQKLMYMIKFMDDQDEQLAVRNPQSRPPSLLEVIREARKLEAFALEIERDTVPFKALMAWGRSLKARALREEPYVLESEPEEPDVFESEKRGLVFASNNTRGTPPQVQQTRREDQAEKHGKEKNIEGPWTLVQSE